MGEWCIVGGGRQPSSVLERDGRRTVRPGRELRYSEHYLAADDIVISLGSHRRRYFNGLELERFLFPRLKDAVGLGVREQMALLWQLRVPEYLFAVAIVVVAVFCAAVMAFLP